MTLSEYIADFYIHTWLGIPRPIPGPLAYARPVERVERPVVKEAPGVYLISKKTNTYGFTMNRAPKSDKNPTLTNEDILLLKKRGYKNDTLNARAKQLWAAGMTAPEGAKELNISTDYAKKLWGTFSTANPSAK